MTKPNNVSRAAYNLLIDDPQHLRKYWERWMATGMAFDFNWYEECFNNYNAMSRITKFRDFQYRLNLFKIITKNDLLSWNISTDNACALCNDYCEDIPHLFYSCRCTEEIREFIVQKLNERQIEFVMNINTFIFSRVHKSKGHIANFLVLFAKQYIYKCKCLGKVPRALSMWKEFEFLQSVEMAIATKKHRLRKHCNKWGPIFDLEQEVNQVPT